MTPPRRAPTLPVRGSPRYEIVDVSSPSSPRETVKKRWLAGLLGFLLALGGAGLLRAWGVEILLEEAGRGARQVSAWLEPLFEETEEQPIEEEPEGRAGWALEADPGDTSEIRGDARVRGVRSRVTEGKPVPSEFAFIPARSVLSWAERQKIPRVRARAATRDLPAGLEIEGGASWISLLEEGDRLIAIQGVPVADRESALTLILEERARRNRTLTATFVRRVQGKPARFSIVIEQPYLEEEAAPRGF